MGGVDQLEMGVCMCAGGYAWRMAEQEASTWFCRRFQGKVTGHPDKLGSLRSKLLLTLSEPVLCSTKSLMGASKAMPENESHWQEGTIIMLCSKS